MSARKRSDNSSLGLVRALVCSLSLVACSKTPEHQDDAGVGMQEHHDDHDEHESEDAEHASEKTDAHHLAGEHAACEDVVLPAGSASRYGIEVEPARAIELVPTISAPGHLAFPQGALARIGSAVAGRVAAVHVRSGERVAAGDALLTVDSPLLGEAQSDFLQKRTVVESAGPTLALARSAYERAKELFDSVQGVALSEVERRETELRQAERDQSIARAAEAAARNRLLLLGMREADVATLIESGTMAPQHVIRSPIAGSVVDVSVTLGELVDPEKDRLVVIGNASTLWAIAEVSEARLSEVRLGARARVRVSALAPASFDGLVAATAAVLEPATRTAEVRIEIPNPDGTLLPGMFLQAEIESSSGAGVATLVVPDGAVLNVEGRPAVFVPIGPDSSTYCKHEVVVGPAVGDHVPVLEGLAAGDLVVVAGAFRLKAEHGKSSASHEH